MTAKILWRRHHEGRIIRKRRTFKNILHKFPSISLGRGMGSLGSLPKQNNERYWHFLSPPTCRYKKSHDCSEETIFKNTLASAATSATGTISSKVGEKDTRKSTKSTRLETQATLASQTKQTSSIGHVVTSSPHGLVSHSVPENLKKALGKSDLVQGTWSGPTSGAPEDWKSWNTLRRVLVQVYNLLEACF